jgi:hypothetical protein
MTNTINTPRTTENDKPLLVWETPRLLRLSSPDTNAGTSYRCTEGYHVTCMCVPSAILSASTTTTPTGTTS